MSFATFNVSTFDKTKKVYKIKLILNKFSCFLSIISKTGCTLKQVWLQAGLWRQVPHLWRGRAEHGRTGGGPGQGRAPHQTGPVGQGARPGAGALCNQGPGSEPIRRAVRSAAPARPVVRVRRPAAGAGRHPAPLPGAGVRPAGLQLPRLCGEWIKFFLRVLEF